MNNILSLVSIPTLPRDISQSFHFSDVSSIALVPSHCGLLRPNGAIDLKLDRLLNLMSSQKIAVHSIQGVLFGIDPNDSELVLKITNRFTSIFEIAKLLSIKKVVIGAPEFRRSLLLWKNVLDAAANSFLSNGLSVFIENLCDYKSNIEHEAFGPKLLDPEVFNLALDISNAAECSVHYKELTSGAYMYPLVHISGKNHKAIENQKQAKWIADVLALNGSNSDLVWELNYKDLSQLFDAFRKSTSLLRDQEPKWKTHLHD